MNTTQKRHADTSPQIALHKQLSPQLQPRYVRVNTSASGFVKQRPVTDDQFLEQTPWANPQHPAHHQIPITAHRRVSHQSRPSSPFITPAAQRSIIDGIMPNGSASTIADLYSTHSSSIAPTPASVEQTSTIVLKGGLIPYTPSKPNRVDLQATNKGITSTILPDEADSQQNSKPGMTPGISELEIMPGQRPYRILSPPQKSRLATLQTLDAPSKMSPQSFRIPNSHSDAEEVDQARRHDTPIHQIIPHQVGVMSGAERAK